MRRMPRMCRVMLVNWPKLFPDAGHRHHMAVAAGNAADYWSRQDATGAVVAERRQWLLDTPELYAACLPEGRELAEEACAWMRQWNGAEEPDWVILSGDASQSHPLLGGEVVFPSAWSLPEKIGRPLFEVHAPVPGLEESLGRSISVFLARLEPEVAWERENWGLSADQQLNHHPSRALAGLTAEARLDTTWIRLERQFLMRLPVTQGILFGIRVSHHRLDHVAALEGMAPRLARAFESMSVEVARYKGLHDCRESLICQLTHCG